MENNLTQTKTIFWADDDADDLEVFREVAKELAPDHTLIEFKNGRDLLDHLEKLPQQAYPCMIVLDMNMPVLSGSEALVLLKGEPKYDAIPVVMFTTSSSSLDKMFCRRYNTELITKPPSFHVLRKILPTLLAYCRR